MVSANGCHEILANDFSLAIGQQALTVGAGGGSQEVYLLLLKAEAERILIEHRRHVVGGDADHVAHQHAGHAGYVVVGAVDHNGQTRGDAAVDGASGCGGSLSLQAVTDEAASADQHQSVDDLAGTGSCWRAVNAEIQLGLGIGEVPGDGAFVTRCAGDNGVERGAPGVHWVGDHFDLLGYELRLVGHGGDPLAGSCVG